MKLTDVMKVRIKKLHKEATTPRYHHGAHEDAAVDLHATEGAVIPPHRGLSFGTGVAFEMPAGVAGLVWDRSGLAFKNGLTTLGGMIDPGYRGEVKVYLYNTSSEPFTVNVGDRIAQMIFVSYHQVELEEVEELSESERGDSGFGQTGAA